MKSTLTIASIDRRNLKNRIKLIVCIFLITLSSKIFADYPIVSYRYLADPGALVYEGRVYLYCSNDDQNPVEGSYKMRSIVCVSSSDLKNWTDHGIVFQVPENAPWAEKSWAPSPVERDGKFYLYFGNGGSGIGVSKSDSPTGPFVDPIGQPLITPQTPGVLPAENLWLFDPMTFVDEDGQAYMYFGGNGENNMRIIKLNDDMISVDGSATRFTVPYFFEASWMHKHNGKYYFSYSTNPRNGMRIDYMISDNPLTGFVYGGVVSLQPPNNNNNNHQALFEFKGKWYQAYHNRTVAAQEDIPAGFRRNLCLDQIFYKEDGSIETMVNTIDGVAQLEYVNPFLRVEAETMNAQSGIETEADSKGGMYGTKIGNGDWIKVRGVDFGPSGTAAFTASMASEMKVGYSKTGAIELRIDDIDGTLIGTLPVSYTGGTDVWKQETTNVNNVTGVHDVYLVFKCQAGSDLFNLDYWYFTRRTNSKNLLAITSNVDDYKIDKVAGFNTTNINVKAIYTDGSYKDITPKASFSYNTENIISVSDGQIRGENYGCATVVVGYKGKTDTAKIIVKDMQAEFKVSRLLIDESNLKLFTGSSVAFKLLAEYEDGHIEDVTHKASYKISTPEIATLSSGFITTGSEGEVDIWASYPDKLGDTLSTIIHVAVSPRDGVWLEAECGNAGTFWDVINDETASNKEYVTINPGNNSIDAAPVDEKGLITYSFDLEAGGMFKLYARVICQNSNEDSFWIKLDDRDFTSWNNIASSRYWTWANFSETFNLKAGEHTLVIGYREDGAKLDKLWISPDLKSEISDMGNVGSNCKRKTTID